MLLFLCWKVDQVIKHLFHGFLVNSRNCCPSVSGMTLVLFPEAEWPRATVPNVSPDTEGQQFWLFTKHPWNKCFITLSNFQHRNNSKLHFYLHTTVIDKINNFDCLTVKWRHFFDEMTSLFQRATVQTVDRSTVRYSPVTV